MNTTKDAGPASKQEASVSPSDSAGKLDAPIQSRIRWDHRHEVPGMRYCAGVTYYVCVRVRVCVHSCVNAYAVALILRQFAAYTHVTCHQLQYLYQQPDIHVQHAWYACLLTQVLQLVTCVYAANCLK